MNLTTFNINDGWPAQSHFYYNSTLNTNNYETYAVDNISKDDNSEICNSPNEFYNTSPKEMVSEAYYEQNYPVVDRESNEYEANDRRTKQYVTNNLMNESNYCAVDTSNSNCPISPRHTSFITKYSHLPIGNPSHHSRNSSSNDNIREKKFISELHINIKEPSTDDPENNDNHQFLNDYENYTKIPDPHSQPNGYHLSSFETFITGQHNQLEFAQAKNNVVLSEIRSSSSDSPNRKRECHHSEKFIYLGCDAQSTTRIVEDTNERNSYHSTTIFDKGLQRPYLLHSRQSENIDDLKSFSSKSVQTSKRLDCIIKDTCDQSVETENVNEIHCQLQKEPIKVCNKNTNPTKRRPVSRNSISDNESMSSDNFSEVKLKNYRKKHELDRDVKKSNIPDKKMQKPNTKGPVKIRYQNTDDTNQDTCAGSYSESFTQSNDLDESPVKERSETTGGPHDAHIKNTLNKVEVKNIAPLTNSMSHINNKLISRNKSKKDSFENKDHVHPNEKSIGIRDLRQNQVNKDETDRHSMEIQCLLDNLNTHLQNTVNSHSKPMKLNMSKGQTTPYTNVGSFWDNPLNPETTRSLFMGKQNTPKVPESMRQKSINPEIQAIFETLDKSHNYDKIDNARNNQKQPSNMDLNIRNQKIHKLAMGDSHSIKMCNDGIGSADNVNDPRFPSSLKYQKSFDLSPYDELVKSHLNSSDRRIKSVAAKNGCRIVIDGPISLIDPTTTCQAIRNKIAFRCAIAGPSKDRLDKCLNYLKETFPNTCLRSHCRNNPVLKP